jgi:hypothetical protein
MNSSTNPYATYATNAQPKLHMDVADQLKNHQKEEQEKQSPKILPFTSETLKERVGDMYIALLEIKKCINLTEKEPKRDKQAVKDALKVIDEIGQKITMDLSNYIDKLYL